MAQIKTLDQLASGTSAKIKTMGASGSIRRRMQDIGFLDGVTVKCLFRSGSGEPAAFLISGAVIALRLEEMRCIAIDFIENDDVAAESAGCALWG